MSDLLAILNEATTAFAAVTTLPDLEQTKAKFLGKSGSLTAQLKSLGALEAEARKTAGAAINETKSKRQLRGTTEIHATNMGNVRAMLPYA